MGGRGSGWLGGGCRVVVSRVGGAGQWWVGWRVQGSGGVGVQGSGGWGGGQGSGEVGWGAVQCWVGGGMMEM